MTPAILRRSGLVTALGLALLAMALPWAIDLYVHLRTDLRELLPERASASVALRELEQRIGSLASLTVVVRGPSPDTSRHFVDALVARLNVLPEVRRVDATIEPEQAYLAAHGLLYASRSDLQSWLDQLHAARQRANPLHVALDDEPEQRTPLPWRQLADAWPELQRFPDGYLASADGRTTVVKVQPARSAVNLDDALALTNAVQQAVDAIGLPPGVQVGYGGEVQGLVEAQAHVKADLWTSSLLVLLAVALVLVAFFRSWHALPLLGFPVLVGTVLTFAISRGVLGALNPNTAFLGSVIVGNGINAGILWLAAFQQARVNETDLERVAIVASRTTWRGTLAASLAASASFASLAVVDFRGFHQFGFLGGLGMVVCWGATFLLLPASTLWLGQRWPRLLGPPPSGRSSSLGHRFARAVTGHPRRVLLCAAAFSLALLPGVWRWWQSPVEFDMSRLGSRRAEVDGARFWDREADAVLGSYQTPTVVLTDSPQESQRIAEALRQSSRDSGSTIARVLTLADLLPAEQTGKVALIQAVLAQVAPLGRPSEAWLKQVPNKERAWVERLLRDSRPSLVTEADLPPRWQAPFRQPDGRLAGQLVLVYPCLDLEPGAGFLAHAAEVRAATIASEPSARVAGAMVLTSDLLAAVSRDGQTASWCSLAAVVLLTVLALRRPAASARVLGSLGLGVLWLLGVMGWYGLRFNFANFTVMPITFGIGVDYAVNFHQRQDQRHDVVSALRETVGPIFLCSLTTILGYASLVVADNRAMQTFGITAVLGEVACLMSALVVLPAVMAVHLPSKNLKQQG